MYTVMVTGGIGSGKSTLCELLCEHGALSIDLDAVSHELLETDEEMVADLVAEFGSGILGAGGAVVPARLAERAFATPEATRAMNAITFPRITGRVSDYILDVHCVPRHSAKFLVVEVPLLTEAPEFAKLADEVIAVTAPAELRLSRAIARGMDAHDVLRRMEKQPTDAERAAIADTLCENTGTRDDLQTWVEEWLAVHGAFECGASRDEG